MSVWYIIILCKCDTSKLAFKSIDWDQIWGMFPTINVHIILDRFMFNYIVQMFNWSSSVTLLHSIKYLLSYNAIKMVYLNRYITWNKILFHIFFQTFLIFREADFLKGNRNFSYFFRYNKLTKVVPASDVSIFEKVSDLFCNFLA